MFEDQREIMFCLLVGIRCFRCCGRTDLFLENRFAVKSLILKRDEFVENLLRNFRLPQLRQRMVGQPVNCFHGIIRFEHPGIVRCAGVIKDLGLGVSLAYGYVFWLGAPGLSGALFGWSALYPELRLTPHLDASTPLSILAAVVLPYVAVGLVPAFRAAVMDPLDAQRGRS